MPGRKFESRPGALRQQRDAEAAERRRKLITDAKVESVERDGRTYTVRVLPAMQPSGEPAPVTPRAPVRPGRRIA